jgi:hypothetical protein
MRGPGRKTNTSMSSWATSIGRSSSSVSGIVWTRKLGPRVERREGRSGGSAIRLEERARIFDSFECAIHAMAPTCVHCGFRVIGHGVEADGLIFCCAKCARRAGIEKVHA